MLPSARQIKMECERNMKVTEESRTTLILGYRCLRAMIANRNRFCENHPDNVPSVNKFNASICKAYSELLACIDISWSVVHKWQHNLPFGDTELQNIVQGHKEHLERLSHTINEEWRIYNQNVGNPNYAKLRRSWQDKFILLEDQCEGK